ncbi:MAG: hypothetical protein ACXWCY_08825 [Burkholderiales bacterium]
MTTVYVKLTGLAEKWTKPCQHAATRLNALFKQNNIDVLLTLRGSSEPTITVKTDSTIQGDLVHGKTSAEYSDSGKMLQAEVRLPVNVTINTPQGIRDAGPGILEVIAGHEFVHALGHSGHNSKLMGQTMQKSMGDKASADQLKAGDVAMPPLVLSSESISNLKAIWK